jgi:ADP-ribose pyrophosphatase
VTSRSAVSEGNGWETVSSETHFQNKHLEVVTEKTRTPSRQSPQPWTIVRRKRAVAIAAMTSDGKMILIRQERIPVRGALWEVPAGQIDEASSDAKATADVALRELREETGYELAESGELIALGDFFTSPGMTDEQVYFFLARPVRQCAAGHAHEESESIVDCRAFTPSELRRMIDHNEIRNGNTLGICAHLIARGLLSFDQE